MQNEVAQRKHARRIAAGEMLETIEIAIATLQKAAELAAEIQTTGRSLRSCEELLIDAAGLIEPLHRAEGAAMARLEDFAASCQLAAG